MDLRRFRFASALVALSLILACHVIADAAGENWQVGLSATYTSGDYGTRSRTNTTYVPLSIRRLLRDGDLTLIIPYLRVSSTGSITLVNGIPVQTQSRRKGRRRPTTTSARTTTDEGLGDIVLQGRYYILDEHGLVPTVALVGRIKTPTADSEKGLGTGEFDEGVGIEISKAFGERWIGFLDGGYTFLGKQPGLSLLNQWNYDVGLGYWFMKDLLGSVYYEEWYKVVATQENPRDVLFAVNYKATQAVRLSSSFLVGLSNGAPQYGITGAVTFRF